MAIFKIKISILGTVYKKRKAFDIANAMTTPVEVIDRAKRIHLNAVDGHVKTG